MSVGKQFLSAVIKSGNKNTLNRVKTELFYSKQLSGDNYSEQGMLEFVQSHVLHYRVLPSKSVLTDAGYQWIDSDQPAEYFIEKLKERALYNAYKDFQGKITPLITQGFDLETAADLIKDFGGVVSYLSVADKFKSISEIGQEIQSQIEHRKNGTPEIFIPFGWNTLDQLTGGISGGDLAIFAARPGVGKSSAISYMSHHAWKQGFSPLLLTMEMTDVQLARRIYGLEGSFNPNLVRRGIPDNAVEERLAGAVDAFDKGVPFNVICGQTRQTVESITALVDELRPDVLYIDAAYLISIKGSNTKMWERLGAVAEKLKELAITRNIPIIMTVQFNRDAAKNKNFELDTLAGSDSLGQLGSIIVAIKAADEPNEETRRTLTVIKNREGGIEEFDIHYTFDPPNFTEVTSMGISNNQDEDEIVF